MDLWGRLSNPPEAIETVAAQGSEPIGEPRERTENARIGPPKDPSETPREEKGRLSNPTQRRLSPTDVDDLVNEYRAGTTITQLALQYGVHRTTVAAHLDHHHIPRHHERTTWDDDTLREAAAQYATGLSLADVAAGYGIDAQTVANRFRRAGIPIRPRRGWPPPHQA